jgi:hypothetical protein
MLLGVNLWSAPFPKWRLDQVLLLSSSGRLTPLSFQGFLSALKLRVDSMEMSEDLDTLLDPLKKELLIE